MSNFKKISKTEYRNFLEKSLFSTFFHNPEWHEFLEKEFKWLKFEYYLYKPARPIGGDEAILPFARFKVFRREKIISLPFCEYGGPLPLKKEVDFSEFEKDIFDNFKNAKINFHPKILDYLKNFQITEKNTGNNITYWIEKLNSFSEQTLLTSFRKTLRHEIKNAQEHNLEIKKYSNEQELKQFYNLYVANLKRKKTIPYPRPLIQFLCKNASSELLLAIYKGKVVAGCLFLNYGVFVHYFLSASDYGHRNLGANYLIIWEKIKSLIKQDKILDLGASPQGSNLEIFKRGWGGTEYPIYQIGAKKSEEHLRSSKLRNIWGLLPNSVIKNLSRYLIKYRL